MRMTARNSICLLLLASMAPFTNAGKPILTFEKVSLDLGRVKSAGILQTEFPLRATGPTAVTIQSLQASCGCLTPVVDKRVLRAGEKAVIKLSIHAASQKNGQHRYTTTVLAKSEAGDMQQTELSVTVDLFSDVTIEPSTLLIYHNGRDALSQPIKITDGRKKSLPIATVVSSTEKIRATLRNVQNDNGVTWIDAEFAKDFPTGQTNAKIAIRTNDPEYPEIMVPVTVVRTPRFSTLPDQLRISQIGDQVTGSRSLYVRDAKGKPIRIAAAKCVDAKAGIEIEWSKSAAQLPKVTLSNFENSKPCQTYIELTLLEPEKTTLLVPLIIEKKSESRFGN